MAANCIVGAYVLRTGDLIDRIDMIDRVDVIQDVEIVDARGDF